jgi:hypothetical protein
LGRGLNEHLIQIKAKLVTVMKHAPKSYHRIT